MLAKSLKFMLIANLKRNNSLNRLKRLEIIRVERLKKYLETLKIKKEIIKKEIEILEKERDILRKERENNEKLMKVIQDPIIG